MHTNTCVATTLEDSTASHYNILEMGLIVTTTCRHLKM